MTMRTFLVTLADRDTGKSQRVILRWPSTSSLDGMQEFVERDDLTPPLEITNPVIISTKELRVQHRLPKTNLTVAVAV